MDEANQNVHNTAPVQGQVAFNYGTVNIHNHRPHPSPPPSHIQHGFPCRNPLFTGRDDLLRQLHERLTAHHSQALHGLGGIGKTQVALEYAYRYQEEYTAVLWLNAQSAKSLLSEYIILASVLHLPALEKDEHYQKRLIASVHQWFVQHDRWLLILDNVDDMPTISVFVPPGDKGHLILATRDNATGPFGGLPVKKMSQEEGILLLLRRAERLPPGVSLATISAQDHPHAAAIVTALDSLPLALDQAGAYLEENPSCSLASYLESYQQQRRKYLDKTGRHSSNHPSVRATFLLCFTQVSEQSALAADLLRCLSFLDPEDIPTTMLREAANELGPHLQTIVTDGSLLDEALGALLRYSLVQYHPERDACSLHRLVQTVLREEMSAQEQHQWKERVVKAMASVFPTSDVTTWQECQRSLPHAQVCATWIEEDHLWFAEAGALLDCVARYLLDVALYPQALPLLQRAVAIREAVLGPEHPDTASSLNNLATLYRSQGKYEQALPLLQRAVAICEVVLGLKHPDTANILNNLAELYESQGEYEQALPLLQQAVAIHETVLGLKHPDTATSLNNLALLYWQQGEYAQALPLLQRAVAIREAVLGPEHPDTASSLNNLAALYRSQGKYEQALPLLQRAVAIREAVLGPEHPDTATSLDNLAGLYESQGEYAQALPLYQRAVAINEAVLGLKHPDTATSLDNLAGLYRSQGEYEQALPLLQRAVAINEAVLGPGHPATATSLNNLAVLYQSQEEYEQALPLLQRAVAICEAILGPEHPATATSLDNLAVLYQSQGKYEQALPLLQQAVAIREAVLGLKHPDTASSLNNLVALYWSQGKSEQALPLLQRAVAITEEVLGPQHPTTATSLNNLAGLYRSQGEYAQALPLYERALTICEEVLGTQHPDTKTVRHNYNQLLEEMQAKKIDKQSGSEVGTESHETKQKPRPQ